MQLVLLSINAFGYVHFYEGGVNPIPGFMQFVRSNVIPNARLHMLLSFPMHGYTCCLHSERVR